MFIGHEPTVVDDRFPAFQHASAGRSRMQPSAQGHRLPISACWTIAGPSL